MVKGKVLPLPASLVAPDVCTPVRFDEAPFAVGKRSPSG
jgi:hypothetical protein